MDIDEPVVLCTYDPQWPVAFERERVRLREALLSEAVDIEHVGGTAVDGMISKPVIDILVGVNSYPLGQRGEEHLKQIGYQSFGEAGVEGRQYLRRRGSHSFNLAIVLHGDVLWRDNLLLRDYLRTHGAAAQAYAVEKRRAVATGHSTLLSYSEAKRPVVETLLHAARGWRKELEDSRER